MNGSLLEPALLALESLRELGPLTNTGICDNFWVYMYANGKEISHYEAEAFIATLSKDWPHYTGVESYPVPAPNLRRSDFLYFEQWHQAQGSFYRDCADHWGVHLYGDLRRMLLDHCIDSIRKQLAPERSSE